tara:strand:+ start:724 stop:900 length:177 start_codon:yes stop_codon:yes gene_type:complete
MTDLEKALFLLTEEVRGLRADLKISTVKKIIKKEKQDRITKSAELIDKLNKRRKIGDC